MSKRIRTILATAMGIVAVSLSAGASAHDAGRQGWHPGHGWGKHKHHHHDHRRYKAVRERVVIQRLAPVIYAQPAYHYYYGPPAVVVGISVPPLVVRLR